MSKSHHTEAQMIGALKQLEAGRNEERPHSSLSYRTPKEFAVAQAAGFYIAQREARNSNAVACLSRSTRLKPEREQQKVVVSLRERKLGAGQYYSGAPARLLHGSL